MNHAETPAPVQYVASQLLIPKPFHEDLRGMFFRICQERGAKNAAQMPTWSEFVVGLLEIGVRSLQEAAGPKPA